MSDFTLGSDYGVVEIECIESESPDVPIDLTGLQVDLEAAINNGEKKLRPNITITDPTNGLAEYALIKDDDLFDALGEITFTVNVVLPSTGQLVHSFTVKHTVVDPSVTTYVEPAP
jgi:hypothetical protein